MLPVNRRLHGITIESETSNRKFMNFVKTYLYSSCALQFLSRDDDGIYHHEYVYVHAFVNPGYKLSLFLVLSNSVEPFQRKRVTNILSNFHIYNIVIFSEDAEFGFSTSTP